MWHLAQQADVEPFRHIALLLFYSFGALSVLSAWAVVISQSIVRKALFLLVTLAGVAGLYFLLGAELLAAIQLIVYVGGTLILIIFAIMLTSRNPFMQLKPKGWEMALGVAIGLLFAGLMLTATLTSGLATGPLQAEAGYGRVETVGKGLLTRFLVPFEVAAVLLLVVMVGAAFMARRRSRRGDGEQETS